MSLALSGSCQDDFSKPAKSRLMYKTQSNFLEVNILRMSCESHNAPIPTPILLPHTHHTNLVLYLAIGRFCDNLLCLSYLKENNVG